MRVGARLLVPCDADCDSAAIPSVRNLWNNFAVLSFCFGITHGAQAAVLALASSLIGDRAAGFSTAILFACFTLTAIAFSGPFTMAYGPRNTMVFAQLLFFFYILSFTLAVVLPSAGAQVVTMIGSAGAGIAASLLWTAQGVYYTLNARLYAIQSGADTDKTTMNFASVFGRFYLGCEMLMKLVASGMLELSNIVVVQNVSSISPESTRAPGIPLQIGALVLLSIISLVSTLATLTVYELSAKADPHEASDESASGAPSIPRPACGKLLEPLGFAWRFFLQHPLDLLLLAPVNIAFGFAAAMLTNIVDGSISRVMLGVSSVPVLTAMTAGAAALVAHPLTLAARRVGVVPIIALGAVCLSVMPATILINRELGLGPFGWGSLAVLYSVQGIGRSVWETVFKAYWAACFGKEAPGAFANLISQFGSASVVAYLLLPNLPIAAACAVCLVIPVLSVCSFARHAYPGHNRDEALQLTIANDSAQREATLRAHARLVAGDFAVPVQQ